MSGNNNASFLSSGVVNVAQFVSSGGGLQIVSSGGTPSHTIANTGGV